MKILVTLIFLGVVFSHSNGEDCPLAVNEVLKELKLKNYKIEKDPSSTNGIREAGDLPDGTKVVVESSGCEALRTAYQFSYSDSKTPISNSKHWLDRGGNSLVAIQREILGKFVKKQKILGLKKPVSVDSLLTLAKSTILRTKEGTVLRFETELAAFTE
jgi:hypothetical protein